MPADPSSAVRALPGVHDAVWSVVSSLPRGRLLDLPCGSGALATRALEAGFDVVAADRDPARCRGVDCVSADLQRSLPWPDASFDVVLCVEGIEHLENSFFAFRELARVLRPGGHLVLSTPNPQSISARVQMLFTGYDDSSPLPIRDDDPSAHHIQPLGLTRLELLCRINGLDLVGLRANRWRVGSIVLAPLLLPWIALATLWHLRARRRPAPMPAVHAQVRRWLLNPAVALGRVLVLHALRRATDASARPSERHGA
jgi:SAM-dependent methyltransferase